MPQEAGDGDRSAIAGETGLRIETILLKNTLDCFEHLLCPYSVKALLVSV
jgi:hypothetical protein